MLKAFRRTFSKTSFVKAKPKLVDKNFALKNFIGPLIALVGRPNVGKSSLFNRLAGKEVAIVHKTAGVTRDRKLGQGYLSDLKFIMVDTPGFCELSHKEKQDLKNVRNAMVRQSELALKNAQMALFVVDSSDGLTADDYSFCKWLRSQNLNKNLKNNIILVANKADGKNKNSFADDVYSLEMGEPTYVSAKHNEGMADLYKTLQPKIDKINQSEKIYNIVDAFDLNKFSQMVKEKDPLLKSDKNKSLQFAIIGRPNVGKSTLANAILKNSDISEQRTEFSREDRVVTSPVPGTTRDSISINLVFRNRFFKLIDTAGLVGPGRMSWKSLEREVSASMDDTLKSVQFANVVCLVLNIGENTIAQCFSANIDKILIHFSK
ncbi:hypothetical protein MHBO_001822 [Bonamia ostreae]|uniref:G domain-containing protein n=1 Tax=Bonamia ostreae TaxID=126728 RepID=A0ABV2AK98_9EUKA